MGVLVRPAPVLIESRKIAEVSSGTYAHTSNDEVQIGFEGVLGYSDGADTVRLQFKSITPVAGHEKDLRAVIMQKKYVTVGIFIDGAYEAFEGRLTSRDYDWDSKSGACNGNFTFEGGKPNVI
jgi:hypothetical protein